MNISPKLKHILKYCTLKLEEMEGGGWYNSCDTVLFKQYFYNTSLQQISSLAAILNRLDSSAGHFLHF